MPEHTTGLNAMPTSREVDANGFLTVKGCPISSFGIFDYGAGQVGLPGDPNRIVKVYRPESAVSDIAAMDSFKNVPFINDHEMLSGFQADESATAPEDYGVSGVLTSNVYYEAPWMRGDIKIFARDVQGDLTNGKKDLSLGYSCDFELKPGIFDGQAYEVIQTNLRGNHIALVKDGRVTGARVLDGLCFDHLRFDVRPSDKESTIMAKKVSKATMDNAVAQLKALLPALEQLLNEEGQEPAHQELVVAGGEADGAGAGGEAVANPDVAAGAEPAAGEGGGEAELPALIKNVEAVLAQVKAMVPAAAAADAELKEENGATKDEGETEGNKQVGAAAVKDGEAAAAVEGAGKASPGPAAGKNSSAADSSVLGFYADLAAKNRIYDRLSSVVGAFDHAVMDANQIAAYGVKKLGIKCADGMASVALDAYLNGVEAAQKTTKQRTQKQVADSAATTAELDAYLKGNQS
jgi:uncharacterized protein